MMNTRNPKRKQEIIYLYVIYAICEKFCTVIIYVCLNELINKYNYTVNKK